MNIVRDVFACIGALSTGLLDAVEQNARKRLQCTYIPDYSGICDEADTADDANAPTQCGCGAGYASALECPWCSPLPVPPLSAAQIADLDASAAVGAVDGGAVVTEPTAPHDRPADFDAVTAAYVAVRNWIDDPDYGRDGRRGLIGCTPAMVAGIAVNAYREALNSISREDLVAHLVATAVSANTGHVDVLIDSFASSLLADYRITRI